MRQLPIPDRSKYTEGVVGKNYDVLFQTEAIPKDRSLSGFHNKMDIKQRLFWGFFLAVVARGKWEMQGN